MTMCLSYARALCVTAVMLFTLLGVGREAQSEASTININTSALSPRVLGGCQLTGGKLLRLEGTQFGSSMFVENAVTGSLEPLPTVARYSGQFPAHCLVLNGFAYYFGAREDGHITLIRSDGTTAGTSIVSEINAGGSRHGVAAASFVRAGQLLYFAAVTDEAGAELWRSDGSATGTLRITDINPGGGDGFPFYLAGRAYAVGNTVFFPGYELLQNNFAQHSLWKSNGTVAGTVKVLEDVRPRVFGQFNGTLYFLGFDRIYISDGTTGGTRPIAQLAPFPGGIDEVNFSFGTTTHGIVFPAVGVTPNSQGLWVSDGTEAGTQLVSAGNLPRLEASNNQIAIGWLPTQGGNQLFKTDGSPAGTDSALPIITSGALSRRAATLSNGNIILPAPNNNPEEGLNLYVITAPDGDIETLAQNRPIYLYDQVVAVADRGYFREGLAQEGTAPEGTRSLVTDGTPGGTRPLTTPLFGDASSSPYIMGNLNDAVLFNALHPETGRELWISDLSNGGTRLLKDLNPGLSRSGVPKSTTFYSSFDRGYHFGPFNGRFFFTADDRTHGPEVWVTDGSPEGTLLLRDIRSGDGYPPTFLGVYLNRLYFRACSSGATCQLWSTDGTPSGTVLVRTVDAGAMQVLGNKFYFWGSSANEGRGIWESDGTSVGTIPILLQSTIGALPSPGLILSGDRLFFAASNATVGTELYVSDGTINGTQLVADLNPGAASGVVSLPINNLGNGRVLFVGNSGNGPQPMSSDGTLGGTSALNALGGQLDRGSVIANGSRFLFPDDSSLWSSDGTLAGTQILASFPAQIGGIDLLLNERSSDTAFFRVNVPEFGAEPYRTAGTPSSTGLLIDANTGASSSDPSSFSVLNDSFVFSGVSQLIGDELIIAPLGSCDVDTDSDGTVDCFDGCANDPGKSQPGICGCGLTDADDDGDLALNCEDQCPADSNKVLAGSCGCGFPDADLTGNGVVDCLDVSILQNAPVKPRLRFTKRRRVIFTMKEAAGVRYEIQYFISKRKRVNGDQISWSARSLEAPTYKKRVKPSRTVLARYRYVIPNVGASPYSAVRRIRTRQR